MGCYLGVLHLGAQFPLDADVKLAVKSTFRLWMFNKSRRALQKYWRPLSAITLNRFFAKLSKLLMKGKCIFKCSSSYT